MWFATVVNKKPHSKSGAAQKRWPRHAHAEAKCRAQPLTLASAGRREEMRETIDAGAADLNLVNLIKRKISTVILPKIELWLVPVQIGRKGITVVRFGSLADIGACPRHVRFTPKSGHRSPHSMTLRCP